MNNNNADQAILDGGRRELAALKSGRHRDENGDWATCMTPSPITQKRYESTNISKLFSWSDLQVMGCVVGDVISESGFGTLYDKLPREKSSACIPNF